MDDQQHFDLPIEYDGEPLPVGTTVVLVRQAGKVVGIEENPTGGYVILSSEPIDAEKPRRRLLRIGPAT